MFESGVKFATANPSCGGPPHSKARFARQKFGVGRSALGVFCNPESEGCLVAPAVFKTVVATQVAR